MLNGTTWSLPIPVEEGRKCLAGQVIEYAYCSYSASTKCSFTGSRCVNSLGEVIANACTNYYVICDGGSVSLPNQVEGGLRCYNGAFVDPSVCPAATCSFEGPECVTNNGQIIRDVYTDFYVECVAGPLSYPLPVAPGVRCFNGMGIVAPDSPPAPDGDD